MTQQAVGLRRFHPWLTVQQGRMEVVAEGMMQPLAGMRSYKVRIIYHEGRYPRAEILDPKPRRRHPDQPVAHTNGYDNVPCLYTRANGDWRPSKWLCDTIVPWLGEWLVFYEGWLATGNWHGGGILPASYEQSDFPSPGL